MTLVKNLEPGLAICSECDGDTFHCEMVPVGSVDEGRLRMTAIVCAFCGERTDFEPARYEDRIEAERQSQGVN